MSRYFQVTVISILWCIFPVVPPIGPTTNPAIAQPLEIDAATAMKNQLPTTLNVVVSPSIRTDRTEFFLGEQVAFQIGKRTAEAVDGPALAETVCELSVVRPDGRAIVRQEGGPTTYDGPSRVSFLFHTELLNDIDDRLSVGKYQILYGCGAQKASVSIQLRELPILRNIHATLRFPAQVRLSKDKSMKIRVTVSNESSLPIEIVIPNSNYWSELVVYAYWEQPPASTRFVSDSEAQLIQAPNYRVRISSSNLDKLKLHTIPAKQSYITETELYGSTPNECLYADSRWLPQSQFEIVSGLVLHLFLPADGMSQDSNRPVDLLIRSKACYAATGERKSAGCEDAIKYWPHAPLD
jgi:hypothetical protein